MSLTIGGRLGVYDVVASLGAGGMGEVYRATDTRLGRQVALKVLPAPVAQDAERLARFDREARTLALLNHPNIAQIYGLEDSGGVKALVMELVEGPTLADRLAQGAVPTEDALAIARQLAEALEAAHEQGIIHRDLKPANIKVRADGTVKVLDFGLAKAMEPGVAAGPARRAAMEFSQSPTITSPAMTQLGMILGTAAYMAPEQASGKPVDKRADIWAFGVVLWEMLTGRRMFEGETISHVLAAVLTREADLDAVSPRVRSLLSRCLEKDARKRLRDIGDAMSLVPAAGESSPGAAGQAPAVSRSRRWVAAGGWAAAALLAAALITLAWTRTAQVAEADRPPVRFQIDRGDDVYNRTASAFAVSPDGTMLAYYAAGANGLPTLVVRTLATGEVREVPSPAANAVPQRDSFFWSPDSQQLVVGAGVGAQLFDLSTGSSRELCACRYTGGAWNRDGTILLGAFGTGSGTDGSLSRLSLSAPTRVAATTVDGSRGERDTFPSFMPDGRRFLFTRTASDGVATYAGSLDGGTPIRIADGSWRRFVPAAAGRGAYLLGIDAAGLMAQPFDAAAMRVTGPAVALVPGAVAVSIAENGVLATSADGGRVRTTPTWFDRKGTARGTVGGAEQIDGIALSPDGRTLASTETAREGGSVSEVWLYDLAGGARTRLTFNRAGTPVWSPDGSRVAYTSNRKGVNLPYQKAADGSGDERPLFGYDFHAWTNDWSRDGRWLVFSSPSRLNSTGNDLWTVRMDGAGDGKPVPYLNTAALEQQAQFSPDGRFIAYGSDQSGTWEIYVQTFPSASDGKWMVSSGGGVEPRWSRDGTELFYFSGQTLMAAPVRLQPTFSRGTPVSLFEAPIIPGYTADSHRWQLAPDAQRFLVLAAARNGAATPLDVIVNCKMTAGCR